MVVGYHHFRIPQYMPKHLVLITTIQEAPQAYMQNALEAQ